MRRIPLVVVLLGLIVSVGLLTVSPAPAAQDATPTGEVAPPTAEVLGSVPATDAPGKQLVLLRVTFAPGAAAPSHVHPGQLIVAVESGTVGYTILSGEGESMRGGAGTPTAAEVVTPGTEVLLEPGEWFIEVPGVVHTVRNSGDEPAVILVSGLVAVDEPLLQPMEAGMATPAA
jgi:quercetin dioxygenase-like cupin family protein